MVSELVNNKNTIASVSASELVIFGGNQVRLAGQIDYPIVRFSDRGFPLIFIIQHATCTSRYGFNHIVRLATELGIAVFRWDKRGTGNSGSSGIGSAHLDTLKAYETAIAQPQIDRERIIILAQNEGTLLLGEWYTHFRALQRPHGVLLSGNMLDEKAVLPIDAPLHIVTSKNDWNAWQTYADAASKTHAEKYEYEPSFYVAPNTNRLLMYHNGGMFHRGAAVSISTWLKHICQISL